MRQPGEVQAVARRQWAATRRFSTVNDRTSMNNETEKNASRTEFVANSPTKQPWHAPEIEEVNYAETQTGGATSVDSNGLS
jgi:hypothetical protein